MTKKLLIIITSLAFVVRLYGLSAQPLLWDEASLGYNAFSILKTGRDEYGSFLPLVFKSFGDYKPGLYVYLSLPFVALMGPNPLSVRLPSAILGSLLPLLVYLLITKLAPKSQKLAIITALLLAINPWNIHFSRGAWETNVLLFELVLASLLFLHHRLFLSSLVFAATFYTYQGGKIYGPIFLLLLLLVNRSKIFSKKILLSFAMPLVVLITPLVLGLITSHTGNRLTVFALWNYRRPQTESEIILNESNTLNYHIFHNDLIFFSRNFLVRYFNHFSTRFLMFEGDWQTTRHSAPYTGVLLYPTLIFFFIGLFTAFKKGFSSQNVFFLALLLLSPLSAALTRDIIQPVRSLPLSLPILYFAAFGIISVSEYISNRLRIMYYGLLLIIYLLSFVYYSDLYFNHSVKVNPQHWLHGYREAANYVAARTNRTVTFTDFYGQPYIYYLFWSRYDPKKYQVQSRLSVDSIDVGKVEKIDNISFVSPNFSALKNLPNQLIIISRDEVLRQGIDPKILTPLSPVNGYSTFYAYETN